MSMLGIDIRRGRIGRYEFNFATNEGCLKGVVEVNPYGMTAAETDTKALQKIHHLVEVMVSVAQFDEDEKPNSEKPVQETRSEQDRAIAPLPA